MRAPTLAVVIPAHNAASTVASAIRSATLAGSTEVVVVDDGSKDETQVVASNCDCVVLQQENEGAAAARARGVEAVRSDYVVLLDADDELIPEAVPSFVAVLEERRDCIGAFGRYRARRFGTGASTLAGTFHPAMSEKILLENGFAPGPPGAIVWRREALESAIQWSVPALDVRYAEDFELLARGLAFGDLVGLDEALCLYTLGGRTKGREAEEERDLARVRSYYGAYLDFTFRPLKAHERLSRRLLREGRDQRGLGRRLLGGLLVVLGRVLVPSRLWTRVLENFRLLSS